MGDLALSVEGFGGGGAFFFCAAAALSSSTTVGGGEVNGWSTGDNGDNVGRSPGVHLGADVGNGNDTHGGGYKSGASVLSLPPHLPSRPKLFVITPASVLKQVSTTNSKQQNDRLINFFFPSLLCKQGSLCSPFFFFSSLFLLLCLAHTHTHTFSVVPQTFVILSI